MCGTSAVQRHSTSTSAPAPIGPQLAPERPSRRRQGWPARAAGVLAVLLARKLVQEWALHVGRLFDDTTLLGALESIWNALTASFGSS
jgi:hypothetical protein